MTRLIPLLALGMIPAVALAQDSTAQAKCPVENGFVATFSSGDSARTPKPGTAPMIQLSTRDAGVIDTTWRFDFAERRWSRPSFAASIGVGWTASGMTRAPAPGAGRSSSACAGVAIGMREPTLVMKGAKGVVHLRADTRALARAERGSARDSTKQPRR